MQSKLGFWALILAVNMTLVVSLAGANPIVHGNAITDLRFGHQADLSVRVVIHMPRKPIYKVFILSNPDRVVVDFPRTSWTARLAENGQASDFLAQYRFGQFRHNIARIVLDAKRQVKVKRVFTLSPTAEVKTYRLVLDIQTTDEPVKKEFFFTPGYKDIFVPPLLDPIAAIIRQNKQNIAPKAAESKPIITPQSTPLGDRNHRAIKVLDPRAAILKPQPTEAGKKIAIRPLEKAKPIQKKRLAPQLSPANKKPAKITFSPPPLSRAPPGRGFVPHLTAKKRRPLIIIDPGHGGVDPGATFGQIREKHITLQVARRLRKALVASGQYRVALTRNTDQFVSLRHRTDIARKMGGDLFLSLHADSHNKKTVRGASVYTLSERASDKEAAALAKRENQADIIAGIDFAEESPEVRNILIDLSQRGTMNASNILAETVLRRLRIKTSLLRNPHRFAGFVVLKTPDIPSVLVELGFISNPKDARRLQQSETQNILVKALSNSIHDYFRQHRIKP